MSQQSAQSASGDTWYTRSRPTPTAPIVPFVARCDCRWNSRHSSQLIGSTFLALQDASATDLVPNRVLEHIIGAYSAARLVLVGLQGVEYGTEQCSSRPLLVNALRSEPAARTAATLPVQSQKLQQQQQLSPPLSAELSPVSAAMPTTASASSSTSTKSGSKRGGKRAAAAQPPPQLKLEPATPTAKRSATAVMNSTRSTSATANSNSIASSLRKPPHIVLLADDDDDDDDAVANGSRAGKTNGDDDDDDFVPAPQQRRQQSNGGSSSARISNRQNGSNRSVPSSATATPKQPAAGTAPCPVCSEHVPCTQINIHLDECLTRESRRSSLRRLRSAERLGETNTQQQNETAARVTPPPSSPAIAASPSASPVALRSSPRLKAAVGRTESSQKTATLNEELSEVATIPVTDVKSFLPVSFYE